MKCQECKFDNREGAKFCKKCGAKLNPICPQCSTILTPDSLFCDECGFKLSELSQKASKDLSFDEKLIKIQKYIPKGLTEKILSQKNRIEGERRQITVMFCDMAGFTTLCEKLDPERVYSIIDRVYEILIHKVHEYEGTVNEMTGDGIMALFGAPIALEDAPQRAIRSSLAIHREMSKFSNSIRQELESVPAIKMRVGLHTGSVVVGAVGNDLRVEFKAVGDTVNLASRMEQLAEPGSTYVTEATFKLTEGLFRFEAIGEKGVKGREALINVYRVIAPSTSRTRFDVSAERGLTPFVGRERMLELLMDGYERSRGGRGQAISIIADAGLGKSRLLYEFRKAVANEDVTFLEGKCLSFSRGVVYHPIIDILKANFDIRDDDGDFQVKEKIKKGVEILGADNASILPSLFDLLSVKDNGIDKLPISPEERMNRILGALKQIVLKGSEIRPLIMAYENLHWIDRNSEEALKGLLNAISGARVFLIFTYRPEFILTWGGKSYHSQINLNRLSTRETHLMISHLLGTFEFDKEIEQLVLEKAEGVPFFIEELINSLRDQKIIEKRQNTYYLAKDFQKAITPSTIHDVIMARIDSLPEKARGLLQTGSVAGREFSHLLIKRVTAHSKEQLLSYLSVLKDSELLYERGIYPQSNYVFKHALTQEVAYNSLLLKMKTELHKKIGKALEKIYPERLEEFCEILALHFLKGEDWQRAYRYCQEAGLKAYSHTAYEEAQRYFEEGLTAIKKLPREKALIEKEIDLRFNMRSPLVALGRHEDWGEWVRGAEPLAREINDDARLSNALNYLSSLHWIRGQHKTAIELGQKALNFAQKAKHFSFQIGIMSHLGIYYFNIGDYSKQIEIHQKVRNQLIGEDAFKQHGLASVPGALSRSMIVLGLAELGNFDNIEEIGREAIEIAEQVRNTLTSIFVYNFVAMAYLRQGRFEPAFPLLEKGHELCRYSDVKSMYSYTVGSLGYAYLLAKEPRRAMTVLEEGSKDDNIKASFWPTHLLTVLADTYLALGDISLASETVGRAMKLSDEREERGFEAWAMLVMAGIKNAADQPAEAEQLYRHAFQRASALSMRPLVAHCHKGLANSYLGLGAEKEAQSENETARKIYHSLGMTYWLQS